MASGTYFTVDQINVLQQEIKSNMEINTTKFSALNASSCLIVVFTAPFFGILMDNFGLKVSLLSGMWVLIFS